MWILIVIAIVFIVIIVAFLTYHKVNKNKEIGYAFLYNSEKPFNKVAPKVYYHKQRMYRFYYAFFIGLHYFFVVTSVTLTSLTITMVMDKKYLSEIIKLSISSMAAISTTLQTILRFDKIALRKLQAVRILEQAIIEYEQNPDTDLKILIDANKKAEETIQIDE